MIRSQPLTEDRFSLKPIDLIKDHSHILDGKKTKIAKSNDFYNPKKNFFDSRFG